MQRKLQITVLAASLLALSAAVRAQSDCTQITGPSPYLISTPGVYCLKGPLTGTIGIIADDVTVDLQGHVLVGNGGTVVSASGGQRNITVRNGTIRGDSYAVSIAGASASGALVEGIRAEGAGIRVEGDGAVVRRNVVIGAVGAGLSYAYGIEARYGAGIRVSDNSIVNPGPGYAGQVGGILVEMAAGPLIERNAVTRATPAVPSATSGISLAATDGAIVAANRIVNTYFGITHTGSGVPLYVDNTVRAPKAFGGGVMAGSTNYSY
jgi:hypothetical protein